MNNLSGSQTSQVSKSTVEEEKVGEQYLTEAKDLCKAYKSHLFANLRCDYCEGRGHRANNCATLHSMDSFAKGTKTLKAAWGTKKGSYLTKRIKKASCLGARRRRDLAT